MIPPQFFTHLPDEVREMWLDPIAEQYGWPFDSLDDSTDNTQWRYILLFMPLREFDDLRWNLEEIDLATKPFRPASLDAVKGLIDQHTMGLSTFYASVVRSEERFRACAAYSAVEGTIPRPVVMREVDGAIDLLDGNHRLAALFAVSKLPSYSPSFIIPAWVGRPQKIAQQGAARQRC